MVFLVFFFQKSKERKIRVCAFSVQLYKGDGTVAAPENGSDGSGSVFGSWENGQDQESAKGAGGKGACVINCHNFFFTPDGNKENRPHNNGRHRRTKNATICDPGPLYAGPLSALLTRGGKPC